MYTEEEVKRETLIYNEGDDLATDVWMQKYALRDGNGQFLELTPCDTHERLAAEFHRIEKNYPNPVSEQEIFESLDHFERIVPQGSPMAGIGNNYQNVSLSSCIVIDGPKDNMSSIFDVGKNMANLYKRRCGVGIDISGLRPDGASVKNSSKTSSGAWSFADFYSYITRMIGQSGRRGALMLTMDIRHPDAQKFATMKNDLSKVTGANVSLKIHDDFMIAVENDEMWEMRFPIEGTPIITQEIKARQLWDVIVQSATLTAEPGLLMWDNITRMLPADCYEFFKTLATNPCAELPLSVFDSCRLMSINLKTFVKNQFEKDSYFDFVEFDKFARLATRLSDDMVDLELEKIDNILSLCDADDETVLWNKLKDSARRGRRIGLGAHGLADAVACMSLPYDSDEGIRLVESIFENFKISVYDESCNLAIQRGSFPEFDWEIEKNCEFFVSFPKWLIEKMSKTGRRNISLLTLAPTGSISIESRVSSGMESVFRNSYKRRRKIENNVGNSDFTDKLGDKWQEYEVFHKNVKDYLDKFNTDVIPSFFTTSNQIDPFRRIEIQAAIQRHIDHSISSTINLPRGTTPDLVGSLYLSAWKHGLKGVTVYVDGSRDGVLISSDAPSKSAGTPGSFTNVDAYKRPETLPCDIHNVTIKDEKWTIFVGLLDGKPYEVFGGMSDKIELPGDFLSGFITKKSRKKSHSIYDLKMNGVVIKDLIKTFDNHEYGTLTRLISLSLRHGAHIEYVCSQLQKDKNSSIFSFHKVLARVLKRYVEDGRKASSDKTCEQCGAADSIVYQEGCLTCKNCGYSRC